MMRRVHQVIVGTLLISLAACNYPSPLAERSTPEPRSASLPSIVHTTTPTPTALPSPTPVPAARIDLGERALFNGDWDVALSEYRTALESAPSAEVEAEARLGIGRTQYLARDYDQAHETLKQLTVDEGAFQVLPEAYFFLGQTLSAMERYEEAAAAYARYIEFRPGLIDAVVQELRGDALLTAGDYDGAIAAYQAAMGAASLGGKENVEIKMAQAYELSGDVATALVAYQDLYNRTTNDYVKAQMDLWMGRSHTYLGQTEEAQAAYLDAVNNFPKSYDSYQALLALVEAGVPVDEFQRGLVDYYAGQYAVAVAAFDRYLQSDPGDAAKALYFKGLASSGLGEHQAAMELWDQVIESYPESEYWDEAWDEKSYTLWFHFGEYIDASRVLEDFVGASPDHPRAGEFLYQAAAIAERGGRLDRAARLWEQTARDYPGFEQSARAYFLAGITRYRMADYAAAYALFQNALTLASDLGERAAAYFWSGKSRQALQDEEGARTELEQAAGLDPTGYYSERARDLLQGVQPFTPPKEYDLGIDLKAERPEAEGWVRTVFDLPDEVDLSGPGVLSEDPRFQRGNELWRLGLYEQARAEFEDLRTAVEEDAADTFRLAGYLVDLGLYRPGILAARRVLTLAGMDDADTLSAPAYFSHIRFGPYFRDLIIPTSQTYNFHPLFLFSVVRQESLFEGFVRSGAGARGLMQIVPETGAEIAANMGWPPDYLPEDLYRPQVSLTLGSDYLNRQRGFLDGDLYAALAAYNAGPGNAAAWKELVPPDPDLFLEVIRFEETRNYIRGIYEIFSIYKDLYKRTQ